MSNGDELVASMLQNSNIDVLSPQLYTTVRLCVWTSRSNKQCKADNHCVNPNHPFYGESPQGTESQNDWTGFSSAWTTSVPIVAPSIVQANYYDQLGPNSVTAYLPNAGGYFVWSNTPPMPPGPGPDCARCA